MDVFDIVVIDLQKPIQKADVDVEVDVFTVKASDIDDKSDAEMDVFDVVVVNLRNSLQKADTQNQTSDSDSAWSKTPEGTKSRRNSFGKAENPKA
ncbi:hypothetical protein AAVH_28961 [Aphelenchoides avenae]|nr:hypothetical protein AAVH_28961 [Aphelenchus avenae]